MNKTMEVMLGEHQVPQFCVWLVPGIVWKLVGATIIERNDEKPQKDSNSLAELQEKLKETLINQGEFLESIRQNNEKRN